MPRIFISSIKALRMQKRNGWIILSALCMGLSAPGFGIWPLAWFAMVPALWMLWNCTSFKQAFWQGLLWGSVYHGMILWWFWGLYPLRWMGLTPAASWAVTIGAWVLAWASQGLYIGLIWIAGYAIQRYLPAQWRLLLFPVAWVLGYWILNHNPIGFPWGFLAYSQANASWVRASLFYLQPMGGFFALEALIIASNEAILRAIRFQNKSPVIILGVGIAVLAGLGACRNRLQQMPIVFQRFHPVVIQGNLSMELEHALLTESEKRAIYQQLIHLAMQNADPQPQWIILPEGVVTLNPKKTQNPFQIAASTHLLMGGIFQSQYGVHNGALWYKSDHLQNVFVKRTLVPFGETTPLIPEQWLISGLSTLGIPYSPGFHTFPQEQALLHANAETIAPLICFDALYPDIVSRYQKKGANVLITLSNLGWYHQQPLLEQQFLAINQLRAAENGLPLILATNTGVSAFIDASGRILSQTQSNQVQFLTFSEFETISKSHVTP